MRVSQTLSTCPISLWGYKFSLSPLSLSPLISHQHWKPETRRPRNSSPSDLFFLKHPPFHCLLFLYDQNKCRCVLWRHCCRRNKIVRPKVSYCTHNMIHLVISTLLQLHAMTSVWILDMKIHPICAMLWFDAMICSIAYYICVIECYVLYSILLTLQFNIYSITFYWLCHILLTTI